MGQLIKLAVFTRNDKAKAGVSALFEVNEITSPIRFNAASKSYFSVRPKTEFMAPAAAPQINYQVNHTLAAIKAMSGKFVSLTVNNRHGQAITPETFLFNTDKMTEIVTVNSTGATFGYIEYGNPNPVQYVVTNSLDNILSQANDFTLLTDTGQFNTPDTDDALAVNIGGVIKYVQLLTYTP